MLIDPTYYDRDAYIDVRAGAAGQRPRQHRPDRDLPDHEPDEVWWYEFCTPGDEHTVTVTTTTTTPNPRTSTSTSGGEINFILTDTDATPLTVQLRNRGGHDARDYVAHVTFGDAMQVQSAPGGCSVTSNPPTDLPEWQIPVGAPASATVCTPATSAASTLASVAT